MDIILKDCLPRWDSIFMFSCTLFRVEKQYTYDCDILLNVDTDRKIKSWFDYFGFHFTIQMIRSLNMWSSLSLIKHEYILISLLILKILFTSVKTSFPCGSKYCHNNYPHQEKANTNFQTIIQQK